MFSIVLITLSCFSFISLHPSITTHFGFCLYTSNSLLFLVIATSLSNVTPSTAPSAPAESKVTTLTYAVTLVKPGDIYEFTVDVKNAGTLDAMLSSFTNQIKVGSGAWQAVDSSSVPGYLIYSVTYSDDTTITENSKLTTGSSKKIKIHVEFNPDITNAQLSEAAGKTIYFQVAMNYVQSTV